MPCESYTTSELMTTSNKRLHYKSNIHTVKNLTDKERLLVSASNASTKRIKHIYIHSIEITATITFVNEMTAIHENAAGKSAVDLSILSLAVHRSEPYDSRR